MSTAPRVPASPCPQCGYRLDAASMADGGLDAPGPGDSSVCLNCGQILIFDDQLLQVKPTAQQVREMMSHQKNWALLERLRNLIVERGRFK